MTSNFRFRITGDVAAESGIVQTIIALSGHAESYFLKRNYGDGLKGVGVILMCQDPSLNLKRRLRFSKKDSKIYMDIVLDLPLMIASTPVEREKIVLGKLVEEVPKVLASYKIPNFDRDLFIADLLNWVESEECRK